MSTKEKNRGTTDAQNNIYWKKLNKTKGKPGSEIGDIAPHQLGF